MHPNYSIFEKCLNEMEGWFNELLQTVPQPQQVPFGDSFVFRFVEMTPHQAIIQKLARYIVGLRSANMLLLSGMVQDQSAIQRILDEIAEDIAFLTGGLLKGWTELHDKYLESFNAEDFESPGKIAQPMKNRPMIDRKRIRAAGMRALEVSDPSSGLDAGHTLHKVYSGYIHAAASNIMDMYGGNPPKFHLRGMLGTSRATAHLNDIWNYFYRGIMACAFAAFALGRNKLGEAIQEFQKLFEGESVKNIGER